MFNNSIHSSISIDISVYVLSFSASFNSTQRSSVMYLKSGTKTRKSPLSKIRLRDFTPGKSARRILPGKLASGKQPDLPTTGFEMAYNADCECHSKCMCINIWASLNTYVFPFTWVCVCICILKNLCKYLCVSFNTTYDVSRWLATHTNFTIQLYFIQLVQPSKKA